MRESIAGLSSPLLFQEALVPILEAQCAQGYCIPRQPDVFGLDMASVQRLSDDTEQAAALLAMVFNAQKGHPND